MSAPDEQAQKQPVLKIVNPDATPEEIAAIVAVFSALRGGGEPPKRVRSTWTRPQLRPSFHHGPGAWRSSGLPS